MYAVNLYSSVFSVYLYVYMCVNILFFFSVKYAVTCCNMMSRRLYAKHLDILCECCHAAGVTIYRIGPQRSTANAKDHNPNPNNPNPSLTLTPTVPASAELATGNRRTC